MESDTNSSKMNNQRSEILREPIQRQTAYKLRIADLLAGSVIGDDRFKFLELGNKRVVRVNLIANVIDKFVSEGEKKFAGLTLDDASGQIRVKTFGDDILMFEGIEIGDTISTIGMLRYFNNELYILPEILKRLDPKWLVVRKLEIGKSSPSEQMLTETKQAPIAPKEQNKEEQEQQEVHVEKVEDIGENREGKEEKKEINEKAEIKKKILEILKTNEEGLDVDKIIMSLKFNVDNINKVITEMLEDAEIYEPKPSRIRLL